MTVNISQLPDMFGYTSHYVSARKPRKEVTMANTTVLFQFDFANPVHAQLFASVVGAGVPMQMVGADAPTPVTKPVSEPKVYAPAEDVQCVWVQDKTRVAYTLADGKYVGQTGARKTLNARLRESGATWDASAKAWKFASTKKAEEFVANTSALVTAAEIEAVRAKAQARAQKKAQA